MSSKLSVKDYRNSHIQPGKGSFYELKSFAKNSANSSLWKLEREYLSSVVEKFVVKKDKYLDFACGTGRIIADFADSFTEAEGVDISESMLTVAREKQIKANLIKVDITKDDTIISDNFDLITTFRFFLKAQNSLRRQVIAILAKKLAPEGVLIFNIHNARPSLLWLQNTIMYIFGSKKIPSMSRCQVNQLVEEAGLEIVETIAMGIIPKAAHIVLRAKLWLWLDNMLYRIAFLRRFGSNVIYVCRRKNSKASAVV
jgi:SAM-dependent methyltransferase